MKLRAFLAAFMLSGCASMPEMDGDGIPISRTGWQMTGGADFQKQVWFVMFWRPWGAAEKEADKLLIP